MKRWTPEQDAQLTELYKTKSSTECAEILNRPYGSIKARARALSLYKTDDAIKNLAKRKNTGQFPKRNQPHNTVFDGCLSLRHDSNNNQSYYHIRVSMREWKMLHVYMWEIVNGSIPDGHIVVFKDKNPLNCLIENLEMVTREEHMIRNSIMRFPEELRSSIKLISKLKKKIKQHAEQD
jgi:hypothetical protein